MKLKRDGEGSKLAFLIVLGLEMHYTAKLPLVSRRFSADYSEITLTQLGTDAPMVFSGPGTVSQDEFGNLSLKLFQQHKVDRKKTFLYQAEKSRAGIVSDRRGCQLQAIASDGSAWHCEYVTTNETLTLHDNGCTGVVFADLNNLVQLWGTPSCFQVSQFEGIIPFEMDLPYNLCAQGKRNSYPEKMLKLTFNKVIKVEILRCDGYTSIKISNAFELLSDRFIALFTEGLSIATGRSLSYIWSSLNGETFQRRTIAAYDFEVARTKLNPPLSTDYNNLDNFLQGYIKFSLKQSHNYFGFWEKLHASWPAGLAVAALPLSVYIEGVTKEFYPEFLVDQTKQKEVDSMIAAIRSCAGIDDDLKERTCNRIRGAAKGSALDALRALAQLGCIEKQLVDSWHYVRNRSAHGSDFTLTQVHSKIQKVVTNIYACLHLFYQLLYLKIGFSGYINNYSKIGFPSEFRFADQFKIGRRKGADKSKRKSLS
ncbi:hypothetical protein [Massilia sp. TS11]|uniref:hypothetical protein n=1 Tax=Massilia sp. TS11 TaxID=2908003 RepID=UPI001EDC7409|nr:hypothetical protein [Massilia sp. TS11]MCG2584118.1 hypothetical protein [Massilia sp. TS11]